MRTNIDIDDALMAKAMECTGIKVKKDVVEAALRTLVKIKGQSCIDLLYGTIQWEGDLNWMRTDKPLPSFDKKVKRTKPVAKPQRKAA